MGKKYIIEMKENERLYKAKLDAFNGPVIQEIAGAPYNEPDLERVRKEAYEKGFKDAAHNCEETCTLVAKARNEGYNEGQKVGERHGMKSAWWAARKVALSGEDGGLPTSEYCEIFGHGVHFGKVFKTFTAEEVIAKIKTYEQEQDEIRVGDIVRLKSAPEIEIWVTDISNKDGGRLYGLALKTVGDNCEIGDTYAYQNIHKFERTGKHCDVATVLEKLREE